MRDRDNQRHTEIAEIRSNMEAIRSDNTDTRRWVIGMVIAAIGVAVSAIVGVGAMVYSFVQAVPK